MRSYAKRAEAAGFTCAEENDNEDMGFYIWKGKKDGVIIEVDDGKVWVEVMSEAYKADIRDPIYLECMSMVNNRCSWLKRCLWCFTGMDPKKLQSYLNWYVYLFRVNQAKNKWPKTERVVRHLLMSDAYFRTS